MSFQPDGHYAKLHIHRITAAELASGSRQPKEQHRTITDRYATLDDALRTFFSDLNINGIQQFFPELVQRRTFNEQ